jgi:hypothetical protein
MSPGRTNRTKERLVSPVPACRRGRWAMALLGVVALLAQGDEMRSPHYVLRHAALNPGGGEAVSTRYRLVTATGAFGGRAVSTDGRIADRQGFAGALNDPPRAVADTVRRAPGQPVKIRVGALLGNDSDPELDSFYLRDFAEFSRAGGTLSFDNGWLLYEPPASFNGADDFDYTVEDAAGNVGAALVTVLVAGTGPEPSQNLVAIELLPNGHKRITFAGIARRWYTLQWADSLPASAWNVLATVQADARGIIEWVDATQPAPPERYYRTVAE